MADRTSRLPAIIVSIIAILILMSSAIRLATDYLWFDALGYADIFSISLTSKVMMFIGVALTTFLFLNINIIISSKINGPKNNLIPFRAKLLVITFISLFIGMIASEGWMIVQKALNAAPFNIIDPIFGLDISFYAFILPFYSMVLKFITALIFIAAVLVTIDYLQVFLNQLFTQQQRKTPDNIINMTSTGQMSKPTLKLMIDNIKRKGAAHLMILASLFFAALAANHYFSRYSILLAERGVVFGAGFTDLNIYLPALTVLAIAAALISIASFLFALLQMRRKGCAKKHFLVYAVGVYIIIAVLGTMIVPGIVQGLRVSPNEMNLEMPYISHEINFTRMAYGLSSVDERDFDPRSTITREIIDNNPSTIDNIRILDWRPLTQTYKQTQEIRLYYDLSGIDIDRYMVDGKYTQVMLAPRELDQSRITANAKTWVNLHMVYTHGYGVVMSPVNRVTSQGLPDYLIRDIPPVITVDDSNLRVDRPEVYYGERDNNFVLVNTKTEEFSYPKGNVNEYINYDGEGGVVIDSFLKKLMFAIRFMDVKILLSSDITPESRIMFDRAIKDRINKITPFISLDSDPYIVISEGRMYWIADGYTMTENYPYSKRYGSFNYIRNPVKIVVDAYHGDVTYYIIEKDEPIMRTYAQMFPKQFKLYDDMPEGLKAHIRYPEDLFKVQTDMYTEYHMEDPRVFYNKEDAWQIPYEIYGVGRQIRVEPYYIIMKLPDEQSEEFILMMTFNPIRKDNMVGWMAARMDGDNYGELIVYKFPKDSLIFGPLQIEAKIDQDSYISQQLTLWAQQGSQVIRGNMVVIPIEGALLYVEPLYIQAETGQLPELKQVFVSDGDRVIMESSLDVALESLLGRKVVVSERPPTDDQISDGTLVIAKSLYDEMVNHLKQGDMAGFGERFNELGDILSEEKD